jgi:uncharacterized membrane protein
MFTAILIGTLLRFSGIEAKSLWGDEIISLAFSAGHTYYPWQEEGGIIRDATYYRTFLSLDPTYFSQRLLSVLKTETQAPFYFLFLNIWLHLFGTTEMALRSLSVLASICSIPVLYWLGRCLATPGVGVYSALIFSLAPFQLAFAQYNRPYALLDFFVLLSTLAAIHLCQGEGNWKWLCTYAGATVLGFYTQYLFIWSAVFHWILVTLCQRDNRRFLIRWAITQLCIVGILSLWAPVFFAQLHWNREMPALTWFYWLSGTLSLLDVILYLGRDLALLLSVGRIQGVCSMFAGIENCRLDNILTGIFYGVPILVLSFVAWQFAMHYRRKSSEKTNFLDAWNICLLWGLCIFGGPLAIDLLANSHMIETHRYFIAASGPLYLVAAMAFRAIPDRYTRTWVTSGFLLFLLAGSVLYLQGFSGTLIYEQGVRGVAQYLDRSATDDDLVVVLNPGADPADLAYYLQSNLEFTRINIPERWQSPRDIPTQLQKLTTNRKRVWYLDDLGPENTARNMILTWLRTHYKEIETAEFKNLTLFSFSL